MLYLCVAVILLIEQNKMKLLFKVMAAKILPITPERTASKKVVSKLNVREKEFLNLLANIYVSKIFKNEKSDRLFPDQHKRAV